MVWSASVHSATYMEVPLLVGPNFYDIQKPPKKTIEVKKKTWTIPSLQKMTIAQVYYSDSGQKKCIYCAQITTKMFDRTGFIWRLQSIAAAILLQVSFKMEVTYSSQKIKALNRIIEYTLIDYGMCTL